MAIIGGTLPPHIRTCVCCVCWYKVQTGKEDLALGFWSVPIQCPYLNLVQLLLHISLTYTHVETEIAY